jgi:protein-tyrosine phosphatase
MIDIHSHVLAGLDDGPPDLAGACAMLAMARADGITAMVATPHANSEYSYDPAACRREADRVAAACPDGPQVYCGCELHLTPENLEAVRCHPPSFTINGNDCLLLELPEPAVPAAVEPAVRALVSSGIRPIVAHPERNAIFQKQPAFAARLVEAGAYFQLTAQSLTGSFGPEARRATLFLLRRRLAHMFASDAHGLERRRPRLSEAYRTIAREYDGATAELLFVRNPQACLEGSRIHTAASKSVFSFPW